MHPVTPVRWSRRSRSDRHETPAPGRRPLAGLVTDFVPPRPTVSTRQDGGRAGSAERVRLRRTPRAPAQPRPMTLNREAQAALDEIVARDDPNILGIVLSGSAARGIATEHSDVDVFVVLTDEAAEGRQTSRSPGDRRDPADAGRPRGRAFLGRRRVRLPLGLLLHAGAPRRDGRSASPRHCGGWRGTPSPRPGGCCSRATRLDGYLNMAYRCPEVGPRRPGSGTPPGRGRVRALVAGRRVHPGGPGPALQQVPSVGAAGAPAERPGVVSRPVAASARGGPRRRRRRRPGGVRRDRARVPRLGRATRRARPPRPDRELGRRTGGAPGTRISSWIREFAHGSGVPP